MTSPQYKVPRGGEGEGSLEPGVHGGGFSARGRCGSRSPICCRRHPRKKRRSSPACSRDNIRVLPRGARLPGAWGPGVSRLLMTYLTL
jgi:hypothetical protein